MASGQATSHYLSQCCPGLCHHRATVGHDELRSDDNCTSVMYHQCVSLSYKYTFITPWWNMHGIRGPFQYEYHDDVIKWKHFPRYWPFVRRVYWSPVNSPHKGQWRGALMFSLICDWINHWVNNRDASNLRRHHAHYAPSGNPIVEI